MPKKKDEESKAFLKSLNAETEKFVLGELERQEKRIGAELKGETRIRYLRDAANRFLNKKQFEVERKKLMGKVRKRSTVEKLSCVLTEKEVTAKGREMASVNFQIRKVEAEKKKIMDDFKARLSELEAQEMNLSNTVRTGEEIRDIEVQIEYHWPEGKKFYRRTDTGVIYDKRPIQDHEKQMDFFNT